MKRILVFLMAAIMVGGLALSAQAVTVLDPDNSEMHLYQIVQNSAFGSLTGYASSQAFAAAFPVLESLPGSSGGYYVTAAYATFASFTQDPGIYLTGSPGTMVKIGSPFPVGPDGIFSIGPKQLQPTGDFGFFDQTNYGGTKYTQLALNSDNPAQSNGLIFKISDDHFIVAFEDGGWDQPLGDGDYNDLVLNVTTASPAPIPGTVLLLGTGLLGLVGLGWRKRG